MGVVVDSSVFVAVQRRRFDWRAFAGSLGSEELYVTAITLSELLHGAHRAQTEEQREKRLRFRAPTRRISNRSARHGSTFRRGLRLIVERQSGGW